MDIENKPSKIHPLAAAAAITLILACLVAIASMLGLLPNFNKTTPPVVATNTVEATAPAPAATPVTPVAPPAAAEKPASPPKVVHKKPAKRPVNTAVASEDRDDYPASSGYQSRSRCESCGVVESVRAVENQEPTSGVGAGMGAVVGGLIGNQIGSGNGRTLATIAGAVGGGLAGNTIEKRRHTSTSYEVIVRMDNGERRHFMMREQRWTPGDQVRVDGNSLVAR